MNDDKIAPKQVLIIFMLSTGLVNHVMAIPILLEVSGRDAWVSILVTASLYTGWIAFLYWIVKIMFFCWFIAIHADVHFSKKEETFRFACAEKE
ncbi:hypothetical protein P9743_11115 [Anoxybacillus geothermalis]|nr:hypothetical protein [Anoxybacillus geothermalis]